MVILKDTKPNLLSKGFTKKDGVDYKEIVSLVSKKDSLRIIIALLAHYYLELYQMDVKTVFINENLEERFIWINLMDFQ